MRAFHENLSRIHSELTFINPKAYTIAHNHKMYVFVVHLTI